MQVAQATPADSRRLPTWIGWELARPGGGAGLAEGPAVKERLLVRMKGHARPLRLLWLGGPADRLRVLTGNRLVAGVG